MTNHFIPVKPFSTGDKNTELFPGAWKNKVWMSDIGILAMVGVLSAWAMKFGAHSLNQERAFKGASEQGLPYLKSECLQVSGTWLPCTWVPWLSPTAGW